jgi:cytochrome c oxidase subunit 3
MSTRDIPIRPERLAAGPGGQARREGGAWSVPAHTYQTGMLMALAGIVMLFAAITSSMVVRKGLADDWVRTTLPHILYLNTLVLIASSVTLEFSRQALSQGHGKRFAIWLYITVALGLGFLAGQLVAWRELAHRGVFLSTNPSGAFFYLLTGAHGLHLLGGIIALGYGATKAPSIAAGRKKRTAVDVAALYWHFMDGLWIYILILFLVRL